MDTMEQQIMVNSSGVGEEGSTENGAGGERGEVYEANTPANTPEAEEAEERAESETSANSEETVGTEVMEMEDEASITQRGELDKGKSVVEIQGSSPSSPVADFPVAESSTVHNWPSSNEMPTTLYKAAFEGNVALVVEYLNTNQTYYETPMGNTVLHIHVAVPINVRSASTEFVQSVLDFDKAYHTRENRRHETPLHLAAKFGQLEAVKILVNKNSLDLLYCTNEEGSALHLAAQNKHTKVVEYLLSLDSDMRSYGTNEAGETPLYVAAQSGSSELVNSMLSMIKIPQHGSGSTGLILHAAVLWGKLDMVNKINTYLGLLESTDERGQTPIHYAAGMDNTILRALLQNESSTAVYTRDNEGRTPAHIAAQQNNVEGLKLLMLHSPGIFEMVDYRGMNVVHYAAYLGCIEALDYFLRETQFSNLVNMKDDKGNTPLHLLASSLTDLSYASLRRLQLLIPMFKNLQLKTYNKQNLTPGDIANSFKIFELEPAYQDVVRDFRGVAPKGGRDKWMQPLEKHKVDIEAQRKDMASNLLKTAKTHMVVATLIATVSFAAGLGVPGGYNQDTKDIVNRGTAILNNKTTFRVFLISDCVALICSLTAILCYFWIAFGKGRGFSKVIFFWAFEASSFSILALMVAFTAGTYSILEPSNKVFAMIILIILSVFGFFYYIFAMGVIRLRIGMRSLLGQKPQELKSQVLYGKVEIPTPISFVRPLTFPRPFYFMVEKLALFYFRRLKRDSS